MTRITIRKLDQAAIARLQQRAQLHGHSLEEEVRQILTHAARQIETVPAGLGSRIAAQFANVGLTESLPALRGQRPRPAKF